MKLSAVTTWMPPESAPAKRITTRGRSSTVPP
jgi:hypothetical protein